MVLKNRDANVMKERFRKKGNTERKKNGEKAFVKIFVF